MDKLFSDEQLIAFFVSGNTQAWHLFFEIYRLHALKLASEAEKTYRGSGIGFDEYYSIAIENIQVALNKYQLYSCTFYPYWKSIANKAISFYVKENSLSSKENAILRTFSLDEEAYEEGEIKYEELFGINDSYISEGLTNKEIFTHIFSKLELLDVKERQFLFLLIDEYDIKSIEIIMNLKPGEYYRIRNKLKKKLDLELIKEYFN